MNKKQQNNRKKIPDTVDCPTTKNFVQVPVKMLRNPKLSLEAKGLFMFLLSYQQENKNWKEILRQMMEKEGDIIESSLVELESEGYISFSKEEK